MFKSSTIALSLAAATASAQPLVYEFEGIINDAQNLTFAVFNGNLLSQNPQAGDLPLPFTGTFTLDTLNGFAQLQISGSFNSPTRAYTFDVVTPNVIDGLDILDLNGPVSFSDAFADFDFELAFTSRSGVGSFSLTLPGVVPTKAPQDIVVNASITDVTIVSSATPEPCNAADIADPLNSLDFADINAFASAFLSGGETADLNADNNFDFLDVQAFVGAFLAGCP